MAAYFTLQGLQAGGFPTRFTLFIYAAFGTGALTFSHAHPNPFQNLKHTTAVLEVAIALH